MTARLSVLVAAATLVLAACGATAGSDPLTPKVCKALKDVVARAVAEKPANADVVQMWVVMGIAGEAGDDDLEKLGAYVPRSDAETQAACPDERNKVLALSGKATLAELIR